jgi:hypothetical protein
MTCEHAFSAVHSSSAQPTLAPPQHRLYCLPEPQAHGSFRPILEVVRQNRNSTGRISLPKLRMITDPALSANILR